MSYTDAEGQPPFRRWTSTEAMTVVRSVRPWWSWALSDGTSGKRTDSIRDDMIRARPSLLVQVVASAAARSRDSTARPLPPSWVPANGRGAEALLTNP